MSKSEGEVLDPVQLADKFGADEVRYFLASEIPLGRDGAVSEKIIEKRLHEDLSHTLGNLFSRLSRLVERHFAGRCPLPAEGAREGESESFFRMERELRSQIRARALSLIKSFEREIQSFQLHEALKAVQALLKQVNVYLEKTAPWKLLKTAQGKNQGKNQGKEQSENQSPAAAGAIISASLEAVRLSSLLLFPVMPQKMERLLRALSGFEVRETASASSHQIPSADGGKAHRPSGLQWGALKGGEKIEALPPLFPKREQAP